jgi:hypothetical protein
VVPVPFADLLTVHLDLVAHFNALLNVPLTGIDFEFFYKQFHLIRVLALSFTIQSVLEALFLGCDHDFSVEVHLFLVGSFFMALSFERKMMASVPRRRLLDIAAKVRHGEIALLILFSARLGLTELNIVRQFSYRLSDVVLVSSSTGLLGFEPLQ